MGQIDAKFPAFTYEIERGKIAEFVKAIGDDNPIYTDTEAARAAGFRDIPIPPTFATVMEMWAGADFDTLTQILQLNPLHVLHAEQSYRYHGDICVGDRLRGTTQVIQVREKAGLKLITLETTYTNQDDALVLVATAVLIERS